MSEKYVEYDLYTKIAIDETQGEDAEQLAQLCIANSTLVDWSLRRISPLPVSSVVVDSTE